MADGAFPAWIDNELKRLRQEIEWIESGATFQMRIGDDPYVDVTKETLERAKNAIPQLERLKESYRSKP